MVLKKEETRTLAVGRQLTVLGGRVRNACALLVLALSCVTCGGSARADEGAPPAPPADEPGKIDEDVSPETSCGEAGQRRPTRDLEQGEYCVCEPDGRWVCYGPSEAGVHVDPVRCESSLIHAPVSAPASCLLLWNECADAREYGISCIDGRCVCLVDGANSVELEPRDECPADAATVNAACGWQLRIPDFGGGF